MTHPGKPTFLSQGERRVYNSSMWISSHRKIHLAPNELEPLCGITISIPMTRLGDEISDMRMYVNVCRRCKSKARSYGLDVRRYFVPSHHLYRLRWRDEDDIEQEEADDEAT